MYSEGRPITASCEAHAMPPVRLPEFYHFQRQASLATNRPSWGLTLAAEDRQNHADSQSETAGAYQYAKPHPLGYRFQHDWG